MFCFFEDLHYTQDFLIETWQKYKLNKLDLLTASFVTNAAFDIVRREEEEVMKIVEPGEKGFSYLSLVAPIFFVDALKDARLSKTQCLRKDS